MSTPQPAAMHITYVRLDQCKAATRNPKRHDIDAIRDSFRLYGFNDPPEVDEHTGRLVSGHGRWEALIEHRAAGYPPPARVIVDEDGEWLMPVVRGITFASDRHAEGYVVHANRAQELGGYDDRELAAILEDAQADATELFEAMRYDADEMDRLVRYARDASDDGPGSGHTQVLDVANDPPGTRERDPDDLGVDHGMTDVPASPEKDKVRCPECGHRFVAGDR